MTQGTVDTAGKGSSEELDGPVTGSTVPSDGPVNVVRSEERAQFSVEAVPVERVRLAKVIVSREETITVTVRREEFRLIREPVAVGEAVSTNSVEVPIELVLHEEQVVVERRVVPVERVRITVDRVTEAVDVSTTIRQERIDVTYDTGVESTNGN